MRKEEAVAWAAGLFEGEGSAWVDKRGCPVLTLTMTDRETVERFAAVVEWPAVCGPYQRREDRKEAFRWTCVRATECRRIGEALLPWLSTRRREKVQQVIARCKEIRSRTVHGQTEGSCGKLPPGAVTTAGYSGHLRRREAPCANCLKAHRDYCRQRRNTPLST